jgi:hypothetical protein
MEERSDEMQLKAIVAAVIAVAVVGAGCGEEDSEPLTKAAFVKQADAICTKSNDKARKEFAAFLKGDDLAKAGKDRGKQIALEVLLPNMESETEELRELEPPSRDEAEIEAMLDALDEAVEEVRQDPDLLFEANTRPLAKANRLAEAYGLEVCG